MYVLTVVFVLEMSIETGAYKAIEWREHGGNNHKRATLTLDQTHSLKTSGATFVAVNFGSGDDDVGKQLRKQLVKWIPE
jgi:hypothetical protein